MNKLGSILALIGAGIVIAGGAMSLFFLEVENMMHMDFSGNREILAVAVVLAVMIAVLALVAMTSRPKFMGVVIIGAAFAGIVVGSTFTDIAMLFAVCGGFLLFSLPDTLKSKVKDLDEEQKTALKRKPTLENKD